MIKKVDKNEKNDEEKEADEKTDYESTKVGEVKGVIDERGNKDIYLNDLVSRFDASTCSGDNFMIFLRMSKKSLLKVQLFGWTLIKPFGKEVPLKFLSLICQRMPNIWNWYGLIQKRKIGFWLEIVPINTNIKGFIYKLRDTCSGDNFYYVLDWERNHNWRFNCLVGH